MPDEDMAQPVDDNDFGDLGDFSSAAKPLENGKNGKIEPSLTDDFGDFTASSTPESPPQPLGDTMVLVDSNFEGFGDFDSASVAPNGSGDDSNVVGDLMDSTGQSTAASMDEPPAAIQESHNGINMQAVPGNDVTTENPKASTPDSSSVGGYDTAKEDQDESTPAQNESDDFGDFGEATTTKPDEQFDESFGDFNDGAELETPVAVSESADPFGDFGSTPDFPETATRPADEFGDCDNAPVASDSIKSDPVDDYGDFGSAPESFGDFGSSAGTQGTAESASADDFGDFGSEPVTEVAATTDDFGDFGGATSTQVATKSASDNGIGDVDTAPVTEVATTTDGVGDSSSPNAGQGTYETTSADDSGDFGDFDSAPATTAAASDDFGEFGSAPDDEANMEPVFADNQSSHDDFGDFEGSLPSDSAPVQHRATDDDFGDFNDSAPANDASPVAEQIEGDDFGNFSSYGEADRVQPAQQNQNPAAVNLSSEGYKPASVTKPQPMHEADSSLQKARPVFAKAFENYALDESTKDIGGPSEAVTVESLVSSLARDNSSNFSETLKREFQTILDELEKEAPPPVFILAEGDGFRPNAHFSVPVGGAVALDGSKPQPQQNCIPRPQQTCPLAEGPPRTPRDTSISSQTRQSESVTDKNGAERQQLSEKLQLFLQRIPDLSCLLSPKLTLPANK